MSGRVALKAGSPWLTLRFQLQTDSDIRQRCEHAAVSLLVKTVSNQHTATDGTLQWGAADAEIKVPSVENTELKGSLFEAWSKSVLSPCMIRLLPGISSLLVSTLPVHSPAFFPKLLPSFSCVSFG